MLAFLTLVKDPQHSPNPALKFFSSLRGLPARFKRYLGAVGIFGIGDFSHSLLILAATTLLTTSMGIVHAAQVAGLLYVWRNLVQVAVSYPVGVVADRIGHLSILIAGYVLGALTAVLTALAFWFGIDNILRCWQVSGCDGNGGNGATGDLDDKLWRAGHRKWRYAVHIQRNRWSCVDDCFTRAGFCLGRRDDGGRDTTARQKKLNNLSR
ncbi:membrane protein of unknown function [Acidithiobacillus ferrivorans]|uniref:Major facilitator superfamily (MFS) profile domain-containing protein n=1 Tax=Acidithiobacillus ferrivorans TaxID=160808 RepID=A0A060UV04_9PROT|nr:hypothetical protein [Acidithiobacillus ferrivorans]CDQ10394.1 membrane hypothetical protein [Acidithiobacillus ferrivorans]SMH64422.1 membrane protein of unknown function [Acidithiobacillus ferrivorans]